MFTVLMTNIASALIAIGMVAVALRRRHGWKLIGYGILFLVGGSIGVFMTLFAWAVSAAYDNLPLWQFILLLPLFGLALVLAAVRALQLVASAIYGRYVAARVASQFLIDIVTYAARALVWILRLPFLLFSTRNMTESLRKWRHQ